MKKCELCGKMKDGVISYINKTEEGRVKLKICLKCAEDRGIITEKNKYLPKPEQTLEIEPDDTYKLLKRVEEHQKKINGLLRELVKGGKEEIKDEELDYMVEEDKEETPKKIIKKKEKKEHKEIPVNTNLVKDLEKKGFTVENRNSYSKVFNKKGKKVAIIQKGKLYGKDEEGKWKGEISTDEL